MTMHLEREMSIVRKMLMELFNEVYDVVKKSVVAFETLDKTMADKVIEHDRRIDMLEIELEEECLKVLALHQPVAIDLRYLVGALKVNNDLERIADLAVNISERSLYLRTLTQVEPPFRLNLMAKLVEEMLQKGIRSLINLDAAGAQQVIDSDNQVDDLNREMYSNVFACIKKDPENVASYIQYLAVSRHLERIADYITNIAEDAIYMVEGRIVRHKYLNRD
jgi:phosphate transport system protein